MLLACSATSPAEEWTRFRGPNGSGQGHADRLPVAWTAKDYLWRSKLPGVGHGSPVVWGDRLWVVSALEDGTQVVRCLATADGSLLWERRFPARTYRINSFNALASTTPAVGPDHVYVTWATPESYRVVALAHASGREVWSRDLGPFRAEHGFGASPVVVDDLLIVPNDQEGDSSIVALQCATGETRWRLDRPTREAAYATPIVYQPPGGRPQLILSSSACGLTSLDPATGRLYWEEKLFDFRVVGSPVVAGELVVAACGSGGGGNRTVAVRPGVPDKGTPAELVYEVKGSLPYVVTPLVCDRLLFLWSDSGVVSCLEAASGKVHWRKRVGGKFFGSPVLAAGRVWCISRDGEMVILAAANEYKLLGRVDLGEPSHATPAVAGGVMFLRTQSHVMALDGR